jgi:hypothetical protein
MPAPPRRGRRYDRIAREAGAETVSRSYGRGRRSGGGRNLVGWLAIVALLLDGLLPTGFSLAPADDAAAIGFCGGAPAPARKQPPGGAHCIYCFVAPVGPAPMPTLAASQFFGIVVLPALRRRLAGRAAPFAAAQPRGPPAAA